VSKSISLAQEMSSVTAKLALRVAGQCITTWIYHNTHEVMSISDQSLTPAKQRGNVVSGICLYVCMHGCM